MCADFRILFRHIKRLENYLRYAYFFTFFVELCHIDTSFIANTLCKVYNINIIQKEKVCMEFKEMASVMPDAEVKRCMAILIENSVVLDIQRNTTSNEIIVDYRFIGDDRKTYSITLLPDGVQDIEVPSHLRMDGEYLYEQYLVAKGYSIYWKGNMFVEE